MKVEVKKVDEVKRELKFEIPKERVSQKFDEVYKELGKIIKVKGFRPGKVPRHILESQHSGKAKEEVLRKLVPEVYHHIGWDLSSGNDTSCGEVKWRADWTGGNDGYCKVKHDFVQALELRALRWEIRCETRRS